MKEFQTQDEEMTQNLSEEIKELEDKKISKADHNMIGDTDTNIGDLDSETDQLKDQSHLLLESSAEIPSSSTPIYEDTFQSKPSESSHSE